jgi:hypothetical protein
MNWGSGIKDALGNNEFLPFYGTTLPLSSVTNLFLEKPKVLDRFVVQTESHLDRPHAASPELNCAFFLQNVRDFHHK